MVRTGISAETGGYLIKANKRMSLAKAIPVTGTKKYNRQSVYAGHRNGHRKELADFRLL
ncbi:MAG: hypothetical protein JW705_01480 [Methanosarcinaceae archaeon]|nr:hypothetical protein [Methanosarcinaceae archaeon]